MIRAEGAVGLGRRRHHPGRRERDRAAASAGSAPTGRHRDQRGGDRARRHLPAGQQPGRPRRSARRSMSASAGRISILANGLSVAPSLAGTAFLAPGGVVQFAPFTAGRHHQPGRLRAASTTPPPSRAAAIERVSTGRLIIGALEPDDQVSSGTITLRGALDLTGAGAPQVLELRSGGDIVADGFALSVAQISAVANGTMCDSARPTASSAASCASAWDGVLGHPGRRAGAVGHQRRRRFRRPGCSPWRRRSRWSARASAAPSRCRRPTSRCCRVRRSTPARARPGGSSCVRRARSAWAATRPMPARRG